MSSKCKNILLLVILLLQVSGISASRKDVIVKTPGTLKTLISDSEKYEITDLKIGGCLNAEDLIMLRDMAGCDENENQTKGRLKHIDMTDVTIVADKKTHTENGKSSYIYETTFPEYMFSKCRIEKIKLPKGIKSIGKMAFMQSALKEITLPEDIILEEEAFQSCRNLSKITFPSYTKEINYNCFAGCSKLKKIVINNIGYISSRAFTQIENVKEITIRGVLGHVDGWMCYDLPSLETLKFENFIISTGGPDIAEKCPNLKEIVFSGDCVSMGFGKVTDCPLITKCTVKGNIFNSNDKDFIEYKEPLSHIPELMKACAKLDSLTKMPQYSDMFGTKFVLYDLTCMYSRIGEKEKAVKTLEKAINSGYSDYKWILQDNDLDNIRNEEGFKKLIEELRKTKDYLYVLKHSGPYAAPDTTNTKRFTYASPDDEDMKKIRTFFNLDKIAGNGDEISQIKNIMYWLHDNIVHDGSGGFPQKTKRNAIDLYNACKAQNRGLNCRGLAIVLSEMYMAMGWPARFITCEPKDYRHDNDCHVIVMVWSRTLGKWIWMDPTFAAYVCNENGLLLHPGEVRQRLIEGKPLVLNKDANWNHKTMQTKEDYLDEYMAKNLYYLSTYLNNGSNVENGNLGNYFTLKPEGSDAQIGNDTYDESWFWQKP